MTRTRLLIFSLLAALLVAVGGLVGYAIGSRPVTDVRPTGQSPILPPRPQPSATPTAEPRSEPAGTEATATPTVTGSMVAAKPSPTTVQNPTSAAAESGVLAGISIDVTGDAVRERAVRGDFGPPGEITAGERIYAAYILHDLDSSMEIERVWSRSNGLIVGGGAETAAAGREHAGLANIGARWGIPGGTYELKLYSGGSDLGSVVFTVDSARLVFARMAFSISVDEHDLPVAPAQEFPIGTEHVYGTFQVFNAPVDLVLTARWLLDGALLEERRLTWEADFDRGPGSFQLISLRSPAGEGGELVPGDYRLVILRGEREAMNNLFKVR